jgi:hypothetical protein
VNRDVLKNLLHSEKAFCIAGGPSATPIDHENVLVCNLSVRLHPSPLIKYFSDYSFYQKYHEEFDLCEAQYNVTSAPEMKSRDDYIFFKNRGYTVNRTFSVLFGSNSGLNILDLALRIGANPVILSGYDMNDTTHFHNEYLMGKSRISVFTEEYEKFSKIIKGREVYNTNPDSALSHIFPYKPLEHFL